MSALVGVIKWFCEMHGAKIKMEYFGVYAFFSPQKTSIILSINADIFSIRTITMPYVRQHRPTTFPVSYQWRNSLLSYSSHSCKTHLYKLRYNCVCHGKLFRLRLLHGYRLNFVRRGESFEFNSREYLSNMAHKMHKLTSKFINFL